MTMQLATTGNSGELQCKILKNAVPFHATGHSDELQRETLEGGAVSIPTTGGRGQLRCQR